MTSRADRERMAEEFAALVMRHKRFMLAYTPRHECVVRLDAMEINLIMRVLNGTDLGRKHLQSTRNIFSGEQSFRFMGVEIREVRR